MPLINRILAAASKLKQSVFGKKPVEVNIGGREGLPTDQTPINPSISDTNPSHINTASQIKTSQPPTDQEPTFNTNTVLRQNEQGSNLSEQWNRFRRPSIESAPGVTPNLPLYGKQKSNVGNEVS